jgi:hypothetical protein
MGGTPVAAATSCLIGNRFPPATTEYFWIRPGDIPFAAERMSSFRSSKVLPLSVNVTVKVDYLYSIRQQKLNTTTHTFSTQHIIEFSTWPVVGRKPRNCVPRFMLR